MTLADDVDALAAARDRWVRGPRGPLALVNAQTVDVAQPVWPVPGRWAPAPGGLTVTAEAADGVVVDDVLVDGSVFVAGDAAVVPSSIRFADGIAATIVGSSLRVWAPDGDAVRRFARIARFPTSADWVLTGRYTPTPAHSDTGAAAAPVVADAAGDALPTAGRVRVSVAGHALDLVAVRSADFQGAARLQLIVQDGTSALPEDDDDSSYSMGRFLYLDDPGGSADVTLDWNRAVLPPCAFSYQYACPIPPTDNRIPVPITAGERHGIDVDGAVVH